MLGQILDPPLVKIKLSCGPMHPTSKWKNENDMNLKPLTAILHLKSNA